jgi:uncharacterized protein DUF2188
MRNPNLVACRVGARRTKSDSIQTLGTERNAGWFDASEFPTEGAMARDQYFVVLQGGKWKIKHGDRHSAPFDTQAEAIRSAVDKAHAASEKGELSQVVVQGEDLLFRTEWTYGKDPYPPPG